MIIDLIYDLVWEGLSHGCLNLILRFI